MLQEDFGISDIHFEINVSKQLLYQLFSHASFHYSCTNDGTFGVEETISCLIEYLSRNGVI